MHLERRWLAPLSALYGVGMAVRNTLYDYRVLPRHTSLFPVLSVGNITVGGSGKSPVVQLVVDELRKLGRRPVVLLRGYGGRLVGPYQVTATDDVGDVGDEALMHLFRFGEEVPVIVSRRRAVGADFIAAQRLGDSIVLDDGFQHRALERELDLLVVDISNPEHRREWEQGLLLPAGRLREGRRGALRRAHAVVFLVRGREERDIFRQFAPMIAAVAPLPAVRIVLEPVAFRKIGSPEGLPLESLHGCSGVAVSGTASSESFFRFLRRMGLEIVPHPFPDHHLFRARDWDEVSRSGEVVFTTAKDEVKLKRLLRSGDTVFVLDVGCRAYDEADERVLRELLVEALKKKPV